MVESLKTKCAKAAEVALKYKADHEKKVAEENKVSAKDLPAAVRPQSQPSAPIDDAKKVKDLEKRITKMRNENQALEIKLNKAEKILERELGEIVDIDQLVREDSNWKGRAQKIELLKAKLK